MSYNILIKTDKGTKLYEDYRIFGYTVKCRECDFHMFGFEWTDDIREQVTIHNETHKLDVTVEFRDNRL